MARKHLNTRKGVFLLGGDNVLTKDEMADLTKFIMTRPLDGLNLLHVQRMMGILEKLQKSVTNTDSGGE